MDCLLYLDDLKVNVDISEIGQKVWPPSENTDLICQVRMDSFQTVWINLRTLIYVLKTIYALLAQMSRGKNYALRPESFCALKSANRKIDTF